MEIKFKNWKTILIICAAIAFIALTAGISFTAGGVSITTNNKEIIMKTSQAVSENYEARRDLIDNWKAEQKIKLEAIFASMRNLFLRTHRELLLSKGILNPFEHNQYKAYSHIIEIGFNEMRYIALQDFDDMEKIFTKPENTYFTFTFIEAEFDDYIGSLTPEGLSGIKEKLIFSFGVIVRTEWINLGVTADENFDWTRRIVPDTCERLEQVYKEAVCIQLKYQKRIKIKRDELSEYIDSL